VDLVVADMVALVHRTVIVDCIVQDKDCYFVVALAVEAADASSLGWVRHTRLEKATHIEVVADIHQVGELVVPQLADLGHQLLASKQEACGAGVRLRMRIYR
jgi:hypothetical protein